MGVLNALKSMFGGGGGDSAQAADPVEYNGFQIQPSRRSGAMAAGTRPD